MICKAASEIRFSMNHYGSTTLSGNVDPDFCPSRIPDPETATEESGEIFFFGPTFSVATNITKLKIIFFYW
jgi:hypothetical protein